MDDEEHEPGVRCVAAPIFNWSDHPVAAVSISAPVFRMTDKFMEQLLPKLLRLTRDISRMMGCTAL